MTMQYKILCIGVNKVPVNHWKALQYAEKSAYTTARYFEALKNRAEITSLTGNQATRANVVNWLTQCNAIPGELTVFIFFAGNASAERKVKKEKTVKNEEHEETEENENNETRERCLWLHGEEHTRSRSPSHSPSHPQDCRLTTTEMLALLANSLHQLIVIIDACYHLAPGIPIETISADFEKSERLTSLKRYVIIGSSLENEYTYEDPALKSGILTYYFLQTFSGKNTFFLKRKIAFFRFLEILHNKVRKHGLTPGTRRYAGDDAFIRKGIVTQLSHKSFSLPILEPVPFLAEHKNRLREKYARLIHFFTCTRFRSRIYLVSRIFGIVLLLLYLVHISVVRIHFDPLQRSVTFHNTLLGQRGFFINDLDVSMLGKKIPLELNIYLLKHNWKEVFLSKLDENGKIVLQGNLLGDKIKGIQDTRLLDYALENMHIDAVFYWHPHDVNRLLETLQENYHSLGLRKKQHALELLAKLGSKGKETAIRVFDVKKETYQKLRNLFLEHFCTADFLKKNIDFITPDDYLYLKGSRKNIPIPASVRKQMRPRKEHYLDSVSRDIPGSAASITNTRQMEKINDKLMVLARFGSQEFRDKASRIFKTALKPEEVFYLVDSCRNPADKVWIMEQYFMKLENLDFPYWVWKRLIRDYMRLLPKNKQTQIAKLIVNNKLDQVPREGRFDLFEYLRDLDSQIVTLDDWSQWLRKYNPDPMNLLYDIIERDDAGVFPFLEENHEFFDHLLTASVYNRLYQSNKNKTAAINLAKNIFKISRHQGSRVQAALFLYNKNKKKHNRQYFTYVVRFLETARDNLDEPQTLEALYDLFHQRIIPLINSNKDLKENLKSLLNHPDFFYTCSRTNIRIWPDEVIRRVITSEVPRERKQAHRLYIMSKRLPEPHRKKMLIKICTAGTSTLVRTNAESTLAEDYPGEFLEMVFDRKYQWGKYTGDPVSQAYKTFSYETLLDELIQSLEKKSYRKVDFICNALPGKSTDKNRRKKDFQQVLETFTHPLERILLRKLRCEINKLSYQHETGK